MLNSMALFNQIIDFILPPRCIVTGEIVDYPGHLSAEGWKGINFIASPQCVRCGYPFDFIDECSSFSTSSMSVCGVCTKHPPIYNQARSALVYDEYSRDIILGFKHGDQTQNIPAFMPWLMQAGADFIEQADFLVPVPLHPFRLIRRRFNQSALMAQSLSHYSKIPCLLNGLERVRATPTQGYLGVKARQRNVKNAFIVPQTIIPQIKGKRVVLIDDVYTTGATVHECAKALLKNGVGTVDILTLARVVKPQKV